ncbi:MAG TPA: hypothetical protein VD968_03250 [Pyrinomonadaceae bacterium]|nr:hypothetical protein [Pyrinomonadaceae bacterium]
MRSRIVSACALAACASLPAWGAAAAAGAGAPAAQESKQEAKISGGERDAAEKINKAKGPEAKLQAASEFIKKYPQSSLRPKVVEAVLASIQEATDAQLKISLAEAFASVFNGPGEAEHAHGMLITAYLDTEKAEDAFRLAGPWLQKNPDDVDTMRRLAVVALNESIRGNNKFVEQGRQYGAKAIEMIESGRKPAGADDAQWANYKKQYHHALYRETGILAMRAGDSAATRQRLEKAAELGSPDPTVYLILSDIVYSDYEQTARQHQAAAAGPAKNELLKKANEQLDKVIEAYARAVAMTEGSPQHKEANTGMRQELEKYYKFRHNDSTDGLQQLIDKYKKPAQ